MAFHTKEAQDYLDMVPTHLITKFRNTVGDRIVLFCANVFARCSIQHLLPAISAGYDTDPGSVPISSEPANVEFQITDYETDPKRCSHAFGAPQ